MSNFFEQLSDEILENIPEETRNATMYQDIPDVPTLVKSYGDMKAYQGNSIRVPSEEAGDEDRAAFNEKLLKHAPNLMYKPDTTNEEAMSALYNQLGRPEEAGKYQLPEIEGVQMDQERAGLISDLAYKNGLSQNQLSSMAQGIMEVDAKVMMEQQANRDKQETELKSEWGSAYDQRMSQAVAAFENASGQKIKGLNPEMAKVFFNVAEQLGVQKPEIANQDNRQDGMLTPEEAQMQIDEIRGNMAHPVNDTSHPMHNKWLYGKWIDLQEMARAG